MYECLYVDKHCCIALCYSLQMQYRRSFMSSDLTLSLKTKCYVSVTVQLSVQKIFNRLKSTSSSLFFKKNSNV